MTDDRILSTVKRARFVAQYHATTTEHELADAVLALAAENARLREALQALCISAEDDVVQPTRRKLLNAVAEARAALSDAEPTPRGKADR